MPPDISGFISEAYIGRSTSTPKPLGLRIFPAFIVATPAAAPNTELALIGTPLTLISGSFNPRAVPLTKPP